MNIIRLILCYKPKNLSAIFDNPKNVLKVIQYLSY